MGKKKCPGLVHSTSKCEQEEMGQNSAPRTMGVQSELAGSSTAPRVDPENKNKASIAGFLEQDNARILALRGTMYVSPS